ncbi:MAG: hypothetical protein H6Q55_1597 [Deltaproteobacteria bacterium]|jgi:hypothetical protein|nr:hypothetical protein [Deltaproteobacteria bacterium]
MALFYALGSALVTEGELYEKYALGQMKAFTKEYKTKPGAATLDFSTGRMTPKNMITKLRGPKGAAVDFVPIGMGKPLGVEIRHVYTGKYPEAGWLSFSKGKDMLVTSAMKSIAAFNAAPRAINFLQRKVTPKYNVRNPAATDQGTPLLHYTPALIEQATLLTLEMGFDEFADELLGMLSKAFAAAAGIPIFASASAYLVAAGAITKLAGEFGSLLFDSPAVFKATVPLSFLRPGEVPPQADFRLVCADDVSPALLQQYSVSADGRLVDANGKQYDGDMPYMVISLDGRESKAYEEFAPTAASAALLDQFYGVREGQGQPIQPLLDALKLYSDWSFRKKADELKRELGKLNNKSDQYKQKKTEYEAAIANIRNELLKP